MLSKRIKRGEGVGLVQLLQITRNQLRQGIRATIFPLTRLPSPDNAEKYRLNI